MSSKRLSEALRQPKKVARLVKYKMLGMMGTRDFVPFVVLTRSRTGSNLLIQMLDYHPNIRAEGELFRDLSPLFYRLALDLVFSKQPRHIKASGFKIFYGHARGDGGEIWKRLEGMNGLAVVHLKRRNLLRTCVSTRIALSQGIWLEDSSAGQVQRYKRVKLSVEELEKEFSRTRRREIEGERKFGAHAILNVYYEDLASDAAAIFREVTEFLHVPYAAPRTNLRKQNPEPLRDLIVNYDELRSAFKGTKWQEFFDD